MNERYKKLYHLEHRLYASHAPVLIESGALLLEQQSNALLCQLCFRSIQDKPIKSLRAVVQMLDAAGRPFGKLVDHRYQDLDLKREETCGRDVAIVLPSSQAASFTARISQVSFTDGEIWADADAPWEPLPEQYTLEDHFAGMEDLHRFLRRFGEDCSFAPLETEELWFCTCGAVNSNSDSRCHRCRRRRSALLGKGAESLSPEEQEEADFHGRETLPKKAPHRLRGLAIGAAALVLLGVLALVLISRLHALSAEKASQSAQDALPVFSSVESTAAPTAGLSKRGQQQAYQDALALQSKADYATLEESAALYQTAAEAFEALGDYQDSESRALQCRKKLQAQQESLLDTDYELALSLLEQKHYSEACQAFLALGDYRDSADLAREAVYRKALALYHYVDEHDVRGFTASISAEPDTESLVAIPREQLIRLGCEGIRDLEAFFGADPVLFTAAEGTSELVPLQEAVAALLEPLGDYKDSKELAAQLPEMIDRSDEFFSLCAWGDLQGAWDWLEAWDKPFEDRELWRDRIQRFLPYCGDWELFNGDPSLVPSIGGLSEKDYSFRCRVSMKRDGAELCFLLHDGDDSGPELFADLDDDRFLLHTDAGSFLAQLSKSGSLSIIKLRDGSIIGGVEYVRS